MIAVMIALFVPTVIIGEHLYVIALEANLYS